MLHSDMLDKKGIWDWRSYVMNKLGQLLCKFGCQNSKLLFWVFADSPSEFLIKLLLIIQKIYLLKSNLLK